MSLKSDKALYFLLLLIALIKAVTMKIEKGKCHDRMGVVSRELYRTRTCSMCYHFLFPKGDKPLRLGRFHNSLEPKTNASTQMESIRPDIRNSSSIQVVCETLKVPECERWKTCCQAAEHCCQQQQEALPVPSEVCPRTWDGFSCWDDTHPGVTATAQCPPYLEHAITSQRAMKYCTVNATWYKNDLNHEWTDYRPCIDKDSHITAVYISVSCCVISISLLLPSIIIFFSIRELLAQHRVRLHINFFASLLLSCVVTILWRILVVRDMLVKEDKMDTVMTKNPAWCRTLSFFKIYMTSTNYFWMFCEGYYLHRLLSNAFEPPKTLIVLYLIGWACPAFPAIIYAAIRSAVKNDGCWAQSIGAWQWFIYLPNLLCLAVNLIFLVNILRILMFQLHAHPHEPSNFRRGLKAALMLVPLFGIQLFLTIYRPAPNSTIVKEYDYATIIITNSQGVFVSLIFCFFNGEVLNHMKNTSACCRWLLGRRRSQSAPLTSMTQVTTYDERRSPTPIPHRANGNETTRINDSYKESIEMEDFKHSNGSMPLSNSFSPSKRGDYMSLPS